MSRPASKPAAKSAPPEYPEFAVRREGFNRYFDQPLPTRTTDDLLRLAFALIDPTLFPEPAWLLGDEAIDARDLDLALRMAEKHRKAVEALATPQEKLAYLAGVLDCEQLAVRLTPLNSSQ